MPGQASGPTQPAPNPPRLRPSPAPPPLRTHAEIFVRGAQERGVVVWYCPSVRQVLLPAEHSRGARPPPPPSRTEWTRLVPPPVLTGHVSRPRFVNLHVGQRIRRACNHSCKSSHPRTPAPARSRPLARELLALVAREGDG